MSHRSEGNPSSGACVEPLNSDDAEMPLRESLLWRDSHMKPCVEWLVGQRHPPDVRVQRSLERKSDLGMHYLNGILSSVAILRMLETAGSVISLLHS